MQQEDPLHLAILVLAVAIRSEAQTFKGSHRFCLNPMVRLPCQLSQSLNWSVPVLGHTLANLGELTLAELVQQ